METTFDNKKNEANNNSDKDKALSPFKEMSDGDMWEWNLMHGIGNDIY